MINSMRILQNAINQNSIDNNLFDKIFKIIFLIQDDQIQ